MAGASGMLIWGMSVFGLMTLVVGLALAWARLRAADSSVQKILLFGPVIEAVALAMFAAEHFFAAKALMGIVPKWLPGALFWTYFVGVALLAAAVSFVAWRYVRWAALWLAILFLIIVITLDLPGLRAGLHDRFFWILTVRETKFASGALVLAASVWPRGGGIARALALCGRVFAGCAMVFYAIEHFLHPLHVPGVPLENLIPGWVPMPQLLSGFVGLVLMAGGIGLLAKRNVPVVMAGIVLLALTVFFYVPIAAMEWKTPLALEGLNYVGDTLLFTATVMLAGFRRADDDGSIVTQAGL